MLNYHRKGISMALNTENDLKQNNIDHQDNAELNVDQHFRVISPGRMVAKGF